MIENSELIRQLKIEHGDIFGITLGGVDFIYRPLTIDELKQSSQFDDEMDVEDFYVKTALLWPEHFNTDRMPAGDFRSLTEAVMSVSGVLDADTVKGYLDQAREHAVSDVVSMMKSYIIAAMPSYKDEDLNIYTMKQLIEKVVLSEQILTLQQAVMGIQSEGVRVQIVSAEEYQEAQTPQKETKTKKTVSKNREELIKQIAQEEMDSVTGRFVQDKRRLKDLPDDLLEKMAGKEIDPDDPIAAKLFGLK